MRSVGGRGRETKWKGRARFEGASIQRMEKINAWNHERRLDQHGRDVLVFDAITIGNFGGFEVCLEDVADARFSIETNFSALNGALSEIGFE